MAKHKNIDRNRRPKMTKAELMRKIEDAGRYSKLLIDEDSEISGMLVDEDFPYQPATNTDGCRYIGQYGDETLMLEYKEGNSAHKSRVGTF
jgi:hypothetical protein